MRRILSAYNDGMTADEIGALIGIGGRSVREFAARRGVTISRGERRFRQIAFDSREEAALSLVHTARRTELFRLNDASAMGLVQRQGLR